MTRSSNRLVAYKPIVLAVLLATTVVSVAATKETAAQVDKLFADLQKTGSPGCALGVYRESQIIYSKGYGLASVELDSPMVILTR